MIKKVIGTVILVAVSLGSISFAYAKGKEDKVINQPIDRRVSEISDQVQDNRHQDMMYKVEKNGYEDMHTMMESIGREEMIEMHNSMWDGESGYCHGVNGSIENNRNTGKNNRMMNEGL